MTPLTQAVPAATSCQTTLPLLQRPNCFSPLQTTAPFCEHVVAEPPVEPPPVEGADEGSAGVPVPPETGTVGFAGVGVAVTVTSVVIVDLGGLAMLEAPGAKTPPLPLEGAEEGTAEGLAATEDCPPGGGEGWRTGEDCGALEGVPAEGEDG